MKLSVLYICTDVMLEGSSASLLNLITATRGKVNPIVLIPDKGSVMDELEKMGVKTIVHPFYCFGGKRKKLITAIHHPTRTQLYHYLLDNRRCAEYVKDELIGTHIDLVHSNTTLTTVGINLAKELKVKHVWHVREFLDVDFHITVYRGIPHLRRLINKADARIAISSAIKEHWLMSDNNTWIINDAVRSKNDTVFIPVKDKYLLFCSYHLTEEKGTRVAIIAFAKSGVWKNGFRLKLVGSCDINYRQSLYEMSIKYHVDNYVDFVPNQIDVKPWFSKATAFLMCSDFEGLGRVTAEAMFYGCPVIAHATGGTVDLVKNGETGWLYNSIEECALLITEVCKGKQEDIIHKAQDFVVNNLSEEGYSPKILNVYKTILKKK